MSFNNIKFTTKGRNLHAKVQAGAALNFTKIVIGDGDNGGADSSAYDNLLNPLHNISITKLKSTSNGTAIVGGVFNNSGLAAFYLREIGLFATDPDLGEILYCYGNAGASAESIPEGGGSTILERQLNIVATIGNATSLTALIDYSMYSTMQFVQDEVAAHDIDVAAHADIRTLINSLAAEKADKIQPNWINATLQNGATGTLLFRRNQIGQLEIKTSGNLAFGTITQATVITTLPEGYRPTVETVIMVYNTATNRGIPFLTITSSGNIIICADSGIAAGQNTRFSAVCL